MFASLPFMWPEGSTKLPLPEEGAKKYTIVKENGRDMLLRQHSTNLSKWVSRSSIRRKGWDEAFYDA